MSDTFWNCYADRNYKNSELLKEFSEYYKKLFAFYNCGRESAIEIGAGQGINSEIFIDLFKNYYATEPNKLLFDMLEKLKINKYPKLMIGNKDASQLLKYKNTVDFLIFTIVCIVYQLMLMKHS